MRRNPNPKPRKTARFDFRLPQALLEDLDRFASERGLSRGSATCELITIALSKPAKSTPAR